MELAGLGRVDVHGTPVRRRDDRERERRTDARIPRIVGSPRVAIDQLSVCIHPHGHRGGWPTFALISDCRSKK
jgi:hypothetical protein